MMFTRWLIRLPTTEARLFALVLLTLIGGTIFYHRVEGWSIIDSLYFCVITLTTIGYGDLHPTTEASKLFTIVYIFLGLGFIAGIITTIGQRRIQRVQQIQERRPAPSNTNTQDEMD